MRLGSSLRAGRLVRRLPRLTVYSALEILLLALIAVQAARLLWILVTPVGPVGEWKAPGALVLPDGDAALREFDPFFRLSGAGTPAVVTSLNLKLYGVTEDRATGRGSAIIALPDGTQRSFAVGEEIMPGVALAEVGFDNVTIDRAGAREQIFLDQSRTAQTVDLPAPSTPVPVNSQIQFRPRMSGGRATGLVVTPGIDGGYAMQAAGFMTGDVIVSINGQAITSLDQARAIVTQARGEVSVVVRRGGRNVRLQTTLEL